MYTAGHPILMVCDSKKNTDITELEMEIALNDLEELLLKFISNTTNFDPFHAEIMYTNLSDRLKGDQLIISWKVCYVTDLNRYNKFNYIKELDTKDFLYEFKIYKGYNILDRILELDSFVLHAGDYKELEFILGFGEDF